MEGKDENRGLTICQYDHKPMLLFFECVCVCVSESRGLKRDTKKDNSQNGK